MVGDIIFDPTRVNLPIQGQHPSGLATVKGQICFIGNLLVAVWVNVKQCFDHPVRFERLGDDGLSVVGRHLPVSNLLGVYRHQRSLFTESGTAGRYYFNLPI